MPKPKQTHEKPDDTRLEDARSAANSALKDLGAELERQVILAMWRAAKHNPEREIFFQCADGVWDFRIGAENYGAVFGLGSSKADPPASRQLEEAFAEYGPHVLPGPISLSIKRGKLTRKII